MAILGFPSTSIIDSTSAGRALLTAANAAAQRTLLGLGTDDTPTFTALVLAGQSLTGSSSTSVFDASTTWNTSGTPTAWKLNVTDTNSNPASLLFDLQIGAISKFKVEKSGSAVVTTALYVYGTGDADVNRSGLSHQFSGTRLGLLVNGVFRAVASTYGLTVAFDRAYGFASDGNPSGNPDTLLTRDAAGVLAQRNGLNPQTFRVYNTIDPNNSANYERGKLAWELDFGSPIFRIGTEAAGTGTARDLQLQTNATTRLTILGAGNVGIGTVTPSQKLHVDGNIRVTGAYYDSTNSAGTSGQVLKSTATGTDWVNPYDLVGVNADYVKGVEGNRFVENLQTGVLYGGVITVNALDNTKVDISAGAGVIVSAGASTTAMPVPTVTTVTWTAKTAVTLTYLATHEVTWLSINSSGNVVQSTSEWSESGYQTELPLGVAIHPNNTSVSFTKQATHLSYGQATLVDPFVRAFGPLKLSGNTISAYSTNLQISRSSGTSYSLGANYAIDPNNPNIVTDTNANPVTSVHYYYNNGSGGFNVQVGSLVDPTKYDNGSGTLQTVSGGKYTIQRIFSCPTQPTLIGIYYGTQEYNSIEEAEANIPYEIFSESDLTSNQGVFCGYLIVKGNTTNLSVAADAKFVQAGLFRSISAVTAGGQAITALDDLTDVVITSPVQGNFLRYNAATSSWVNGTGVDGTGTTNYVPKWSDSDTLANSLIFDNGTNVGIGTTSPSERFHIEGSSARILLDDTNQMVGDQETALLTLKHTVNNSEAPSGRFDDLFPHAGISFKRDWTTTESTLAKIQNYGEANWGGGLAIFTKDDDGSSSSSPLLTMDLTPDGHVLINRGNVGIGATTTSARLHVVGTGTTSSTLSLRIRNSTPVDLLRVADDGRMIFGVSSTQPRISAYQPNGGDGVTPDLTEQGRALLFYTDYGGPAAGGGYFTFNSAGSSHSVNNDVSSLIAFRGSILNANATTGSSYSTLAMAPTINQTTGTSTVRGIHYAPTVTSATGVTHRAIETTRGDILFQNVSTPLFFVQESSGNVSVGTTSPSGRLHSRGSGAIAGAYALWIENSTPNQLLFIENNGVIHIGHDNQRSQIYPYTTSGGLGSLGTLALTGDLGIAVSSRRTSAGTTPGGVFLVTRENSSTATSGSDVLFVVGHKPTLGFAPTSGTTTFTAALIYPIINQAGGANGISRGLYVNPTLTNAIDWRSVETSNNAGWAFYGAGTANSYFGGNVGIGNAAPGYALDISGTTPAIRVNNAAGNQRILVGSDGAGSFVGTFSNNDLRLFTNSTEKARITATGEVGIGTASPTALLMLSRAAGNNVDIKLDQSGVATWAIQNLATTANLSISHSGIGTAITILGASGNVGIGTTSPLARLHSTNAIIGRTYHSAPIYSFSTGILIATDIAVGDDEMVQLLIDGHSYDQNKGPTIARLQCYNYVTGGGTTIYQPVFTSTDPNLSIDVFHYNGFLYFWFAQTGSFQTYSFRLITALRPSAKTLTAITNAAKPTSGVTNSVTLTPIKLWTSANDGASSGMDADLLDGQHGSYYATATSISGTTNYLSKFTSATAIGNSQVFDNGTSVGIGTASPAERFHISANATGLYGLIENTTTGSGSQAGIKFRTNYGSVPATSEIYFDYVGSGNIFKAGRDLTNSQGGFNFISNSGTVQMVLRTNSGDVGIGTTTPANRLHVYNSLNNIASFESAGSATVDIFRTSLTGIRLQAVGGSGQGVIGSTAGGRSITLCYDSSGGSITNGVGIGNTPAITDIRATLSVRSATTTARTVSIEKLASQTADLFVVSSDAAAYPDTTNIGNLFKIAADGKIGINQISTIRGRLDVYGLDSEVFIGNDGSQSLIIGNSRRLNYGDLLIAKNLRGVAASDTYQTAFTTTATGYCGIELKYPGDIAFYGQNGATTGGATVAPITRVMIKGDTGRVGIGTASPAELLHVENLSGVAAIKVNGSSDSYVEVNRSGIAGSRGILGTNYVGTFYNADFSIYANSIMHLSLRAGTGFLKFNTANSGILAGDTSFSIKNSGNTATNVYIEDAGNIGIGNTAPSQKVHITGNLRVTGAYYDSNNSAGTSGQILASTGTGTDWVTLSEITGVDGTGTLNYLAKWTPDGNTIGNSQIFDNGTNVGIGTASPLYPLDVRKTNQYSAMIHFNGGATPTDAGGYLWSYADDMATLSAGSVYDTSGNLTAKATTASDLYMYQGRVSFRSNTGLTVGASYTPTVRFTVAPDGSTGIGSNWAKGEKCYVAGGALILDNNQSIKFVDSADNNRRVILVSGANDCHFGPVDSGWGATTYLKAGGSIVFTVNQGSPSVYFMDSGRVGIGTSGPTVKLDIAGTVEVKDGVNPQTLNVYNTYSGAGANYERGKFGWSGSGVLQIGTEKLGTGVARGVAIQVDGTTRIDIPTSGDIYITPIGTTDSFRFGPNNFKYLTSGGVISPVTFLMAQISLPYSNVAVGGTAGASTNSPSFSVTRTQTADVAASINNFITTFNTPASSVQAQNSVTVSTTVNQGAGSTGITRGLYVNPTLTAAADWRSIETSNNSGYAFYGAGTAPSYFGGRVGIGTVPSNALQVDVTVDASDGIYVRNQSAGVSAFSYVAAANNNSDQVAIRAYGSNNSIWPNTGFINSSSGLSNGLVFWQAGNAPFRFFTNSSERLRIDGAGNVGIGTISPSTLFEVSGANGSNIIRSTTTSNLGTTAWAGVTAHDIQFYNADPSGAGIYSAIRVIGGPNSGNPSAGTAEYDFTVWTGGYNKTLTERLRITSNGDVGIGTISPAPNGFFASGKTLHISQTTAPQYPNIRFTTTNNDSSIGVDDSFAYLVTNKGWRIFTGSGPTEVMRVGSDGNVGIGATPTCKLDVAGTIEIKNGINAQVFRVYNTIDPNNSANYERGKFAWESNVLRIGTEKGGTGVARALEIQTDGTTRITVAETGAVTFAGAVNISSSTQMTYDGSSLSTTTATSITTFAAATYGSAEYLVQVRDTVTGQRQVSKILIVHNGTTAYSTEYGVVFTGTAALATFTVDISGGNVRLLAAGATANSTEYKILKTNLVV